ncbi:hypothetical protein B0H14DRAFT_3480722 [Mycena olivaceomarginata]|nr:hypothetical protein B0H14DRAFT_3480722 [Mycena olivaceomarginata]
MSDAYEQIQQSRKGDCNAPATFQRLMNWILRDVIGDFVHRFVLYSEDIQVIASPTTKAAILKIKDASNNNPDFLDSAELDVQRVRVSTENFVALAKLAALPPIPDADIKLVSIPQMILSVAMGDTSLPATVVSFSFL